MKVICPNASECGESTCMHSVSHDYDKLMCVYNGAICKSCIPIKEESPMEYELQKPVSIKAIEEAGACERELHRFAYLCLRSTSLITMTSSIQLEFLLDIASHCEGGIPWLIEHGFIRVKEELLKCCPFCSYNIVRVDKLDDGRHHVICQNCGGSITRTMKDVAIKAWNKRV